MGSPHAPGRSGVTTTGPIRLLFLVTTFNRGGAEKILTRYTVGLPRAKYAVQVAALQGRSGAIAGELRSAGVPAHDLGMRARGDLGVLPRLARLLRQERVQVLFTFLFHATLIGRLVGAVCGVPVRISSERSMEDGGMARRLLNRWTVPLATHVVAVSERVAAYAAREYHIPPDRLTTVPNGVDLARFRPARRPPDLRASRIGCTARLDAENDHATLLHAFAGLDDRSSDARLVLVGRGGEEPRLRALGAALGIANRIEFVEEQTEVAPWLAQMDVYAQASLTAGISNSILEAMASGLPVVATAVGGTPEVIVDGETGFLVPPRDPVALAEALGRILEDRDLREAFGRAGRARVETHFGEALMLQRMEALLDRLVGEHLGLVFQPETGWRTADRRTGPHIA